MFVIYIYIENLNLFLRKSIQTFSLTFFAMALLSPSDLKTVK